MPARPRRNSQDAKTYLTGSFPLSLNSTGHIAGILVAIQRDAWVSTISSGARR